jgi:spore maturation protein CgeB
MKIVLFYHSIVSCWNHGNAHFLRGIVRELVKLGHDVTVYEPDNGWSRSNAVADAGQEGLADVAALVPGAKVRTYRQGEADLDAATENADLVIVHEWNTPELIQALGMRRTGGARYALLFHDTHHRAVTAPAEMEAFDLEGYDAVLAFGEALREVYLQRGWARQVFVWHEAADTALFHPIEARDEDLDLVWIGNWGDGERTAELETYLINPIARLGLRAKVHGVRYPADARDLLAQHNIEFAGWLPNHLAPQAFATARVTVHVPRRPYTQALPGIPTIRVFEALACGIPLVCAPWSDAEGLFPYDAYLSVDSEDTMTTAVAAVLKDRDLSRHMIGVGLRSIREHHTCAQRVHELFAYLAILGLNKKFDWPAPRPVREQNRAVLT